jgi:putative membrane protein
MPNKSRANQYDINRMCKGLAAGLIGGFVASWAMNRFQDGWSKASQARERSRREQHARRRHEPESDERVQANCEQEDDTTIRTASAISRGVFGHNLTANEKRIAGTAVHYALGTGVGGLYGAAAEIEPKVSAGAGLPFGAAFWLVVDEGAVPWLGLAKGPTQYPLSTHAYALASHLIYGLTTELVRRLVRKAL